MFNNQRYMTRGIANDLPEVVILFLWSIIDSMKAKITMDYLQVFDLKSIKHNDGYKIVITHSQEIPAYTKKYSIINDTYLEGKIFVIDDKTHSTMLWSSEY